MALTCGCVGLCRVSRFPLPIRTWRVSEKPAQPYTGPLTCGNANEPYIAPLTCGDVRSSVSGITRGSTRQPYRDPDDQTGYLGAIA